MGCLPLTQRRTGAHGPGLHAAVVRGPCGRSTRGAAGVSAATVAVYTERRERESERERERERERETEREREREIDTHTHTHTWCSG